MLFKTTKVRPNPPKVCEKSVRNQSKRDFAWFGGGRGAQGRSEEFSRTKRASIFGDFYSQCRIRADFGSQVGTQMDEK
jgi:hypothetical protein